MTETLMFKSGVEFAKRMIKSANVKKKRDDPGKLSQLSIIPKFKLHIYIYPTASADLTCSSTVSLLLIEYISIDGGTFSIRLFRISLLPEYNRTRRKTILEDHDFLFSYNEKLTELSASHTYSSTLTKFIANACKGAEEILVKLQHQNTNVDVESSTGIHNALRITNSFSKVKFYHLNYNSLLFNNYQLNISDQHFELMSLLKGTQKLTIGNTVTCVPAHLIVKWITEWQNHERDIGFLNFDSEQFTDLEEILASVTFSYQDDGNIYYGIAKRKPKQQPDMENIQPDEELWFTYWRQFANQKPRIRIAMEKSARPS